jgi:hypothetical protein
MQQKTASVAEHIIGSRRAEETLLLLAAQSRVAEPTGERIAISGYTPSESTSRYPNPLTVRKSYQVGTGLHSDRKKISRQSENVLIGQGEMPPVDRVGSWGSGRLVIASRLLPIRSALACTGGMHEVHCQEQRLRHHLVSQLSKLRKCN